MKKQISLIVLLFSLISTVSVNAQIERNVIGFKFGTSGLDVYYAFKSAGYSTQMTNIGQSFFIVVDNVKYFGESWEICTFQLNNNLKFYEVDFVIHSYDKNEIDRKFVALQNYLNTVYPTCEKVNGHIRSEYIKSYGIKDKKTFLVLEEFNNIIKGGYGLGLSFFDLKRCKLNFNK